MKKLNKKGFTLLELLAVLVILAALATIAIPIFTNKGDAARLAAHKENLRVIEDAAQRYEWEKGVPIATDATYYCRVNLATHPLIDDGFLSAIPVSPYASLTNGMQYYVYAIGRTVAGGRTVAKLVAQGEADDANAATVEGVIPTADTEIITAADGVFRAYGVLTGTQIFEILSDGTVKKS
ncbi:MAG TPA: hypothetical protein DEP72_00110 [Clostridiales bacterium]|nr:MAG: hypothetical protein A2Y18_08350 [Clostridiales bacterium GWD2_32_19]HCC06555.1 hypothetical protein [Clostridiales bacterium]